MDTSDGISKISTPVIEQKLSTIYNIKHAYYRKEITLSELVDFSKKCVKKFHPGITEHQLDERILEIIDTLQ